MSCLLEAAKLLNCKYEIIIQETVLRDFERIFGVVGWIKDGLSILSDYSNIYDNFPVGHGYCENNPK
jgi:hypothetical protein